MAETVLLTGATGFLGRELVKLYLEESPDTRVILLTRGESDGAARARIDRILDGLFGDRRADFAERVEVVRSDLSEDRLGLSEATWEDLAARTERIVHCAASVRFDMEMEAAERINVAGTRHVLELAEASARQGRLRGLEYVGTAYVAGDRKGVVREDELDQGQRFGNTYEATKFEAEKLVRGRADAMPIRLYRPTIIVGDSRSGRTTSFKTLYWPLKIYASGAWRILPGRPETPIDIVPVDYVAGAIHHISRLPHPGGVPCYHLSAGLEDDATFEDVIDLASRHFERPRAILVRPELFLGIVGPVLRTVLWGKRRRILKKGRVYEPYFIANLRFDSSNTRAALAGTGLAVPHVRDYFDRLFDYCVKSDWGAREVGPEPRDR